MFNTYCICNYLFSQLWFPTVQLVLHADWHDVWHSPQPPLTTVLFIVFCVKVLILFILLASYSYFLRNIQLPPLLALYKGIVTQSLSFVTIIFCGADLPSIHPRKIAAIYNSSNICTSLITTEMPQAPLLQDTEAAVPVPHAQPRRVLPGR